MSDKQQTILMMIVLALALIFFIFAFMNLQQVNNGIREQTRTEIDNQRATIEFEVRATENAGG